MKYHRADFHRHVLRCNKRADAQTTGEQDTRVLSSENPAPDFLLQPQEASAWDLNDILLAQRSIPRQVVEKSVSSLTFQPSELVRRNAHSSSPMGKGSVMFSGVTWLFYTISYQLQYLSCFLLGFFPPWVYKDIHPAQGEHQ